METSSAVAGLARFEPRPETVFRPPADGRRDWRAGPAVAARGTGELVEEHLRLLGQRPTTTDFVSRRSRRSAWYRAEERRERAELALGQAARLEAMRGAEPGWDGHSAARPVERTIDLAKELLELLVDTRLPIPSATMSSGGHAGLFIRRDGLYFDLEILPDEEIEWLLQLPGGPEIEDREPFDGSRLPRRLADLLDKAHLLGEMDPLAA